MKLNALLPFAAAGFAVFFAFSNAIGQVTQKCASSEMEQWYKQQYPSSAGEIEATNHYLDSLSQSSSSNPRATYVIPVVFHVLHNDGEENIADEQIHDAIRIMNEDFQGLNDGLSEVISAFQSRIGSIDLEFRLARLDPSGNPTNGIDRIKTLETFTGDEDSKLNQWDPEKYLNIWTADAVFLPGAAAYAVVPSVAQQFPQSDGIMSNHRFVGSIGTASELGKHTLTHEAGHILNLLHPFGSGSNAGDPNNCNSASDPDGVTDTPRTEGTLGSCPLSKVSCGTLDNVQNFMDYGSCEVMFTQGQINRMNSALNSNVAGRRNLWQVGNLIQTGTYQLWEADFKTQDRVHCRVGPVQYYDESSYNASQWTWTFPTGDILNSSIENPVVNYMWPGLKQATLVASDGSATETVSRDDAILVAPFVGYPLPMSDNFQSYTAASNDRWITDNPGDDQYGFEFHTTAGVDNDACIKMNNYGNNSLTSDEYLSTTYDLSAMTGATLSFKYAYAQRSVSDGDRLTLLISGDCGESWSARWSRTAAQLSTAGVVGANYTPSGSGDYTTISVSGITPQFLNQHFRFKFVFESGRGNNLYIDDINMQGTWGNTAVLELPLDGAGPLASDVLLHWKPTGNPIDSYEYQLDVDPNFNTGGLITGTNTWISSGPSNADTEFNASGLTVGTTYFWRVRYIKNGNPEPWSDTWSFTVSSSGTTNTPNYTENALDLNIFPNPTNHSSQLTFTLTKPLQAQLNVQDLFGRNVHLSEATLLSAGSHQLTIPSDSWAKGLYLVTVNLGGEKFTKRLLIN